MNVTDLYQPTESSHGVTLPSQGEGDATAAKPSVARVCHHGAGSRPDESIFPSETPWRHPSPLGHAFVYGTGKAGTSSLFAWLSRDPRTLISRTKETQYFALADDPDARTYLDTYFPEPRDQTFALEATPGYLLLPYVAERIAHVLSDARLIVCLRDPVERALSDWRMHWSRGDDRRTFAAAVKRELDGSPTYEELSARPDEHRAAWAAHLRSIGTGRIRATHYVAGGYYRRQLEAVCGHLSRSQVLVVSFGLLRDDPLQVLRCVYRFLGLEVPDSSTSLWPRNVGRGTRTVLRWPMRRWPARSLSSLAAALPEPVAGALRAVLTEQIPAPTLDDDVRVRLADHYQLANGGLARLVASGPSSGRFGGWMS